MPKWRVRGMVAKYSNRKKVLDGQVFDSQLEASRYNDLKFLLKLGEIKELQLQVAFSLTVSGEEIGRYIADFVFFEVKNNKYVIEDAKGMETPLFKWKWKHLRTQYRGDFLFRMWPKDYKNDVYEKALKQEAARKKTRAYFHQRGLKLGIEKPLPLELARAELERRKAEPIIVPSHEGRCKPGPKPKPKVDRPKRKYQRNLTDEDGVEMWAINRILAGPEKPDADK